MARLFEIPSDLQKEDIYAFTYAESGAMGCPGRVELMMLRNQKAQLYQLETGYDQVLYNQVMKLFPEIEDFLVNEHLDQAWDWVYLGCGNHLFIRSILYLRLKQKYDPSLPGDLCFDYREDIMNILNTCDVSKPFTVVETICSNITKMNYCDAIVNSANRSLLGGGGVDGAIHKAAGKKLLEECKTLHGCETGEAKITNAYHLPCKHIIHTVGPRWCGGTKGEAKLLANCYINSLRVARSNGIQSIAFPSIATGIYGYPLEEAAEIAVDAVKNYCLRHPNSFTMISFVLYDESTREVYQRALEHWVKTHHEK